MVIYVIYKKGFVSFYSVVVVVVFRYIWFCIEFPLLFLYRVLFEYPHFVWMDKIILTYFMKFESCNKKSGVSRIGESLTTTRIGGRRLL